VALLSLGATAKDLFSSEGFSGENPAPIGKVSPCGYSSPGWNGESGGFLSGLWGGATPLSGFPRGDN
jgi:hypothetical protein